jgi:phage-related minor tail protein
LTTLNTSYNTHISIEELLKSLNSEVAKELGIVGGVGAVTGIVAFASISVVGYIFFVETTVSAAVISTVAITGIATAGLGLFVAGLGAGIWAIVKVSWKRRTVMNELCETVFKKLQTDKCIQDIKDSAVDSMTKLGIEGLKKACENL